MPPESQARCGLSRAHDFSLVAAHCIDDRRGLRGDAAQMAKQIKRRALGHEQRTSGPTHHAMTSPAETSLPSEWITVTSVRGSISLKARGATARPAITPGCRAASTIVAVASAGTIASVVRSPARPRSSSRAARTSGSTFALPTAVYATDKDFTDGELRSELIRQDPVGSLRIWIPLPAGLGRRRLMNADAAPLPPRYDWQHRTKKVFVAGIALCPQLEPAAAA